MWVKKQIELGLNTSSSWLAFCISKSVYSFFSERYLQDIQIRRKRYCWWVDSLYYRKWIRVWANTWEFRQVSTQGKFGIISVLERTYLWLNNSIRQYRNFSITSQIFLEKKLANHRFTYQIRLYKCKILDWKQDHGLNIESWFRANWLLNNWAQLWLGQKFCRWHALLTSTIGIGIFLAFACKSHNLQGSRWFGFKVFLLLAFAWLGITYKVAGTLDRYYHSWSGWTCEKRLIKG